MADEQSVADAKKAERKGKLGETKAPASAFSTLFDLWVPALLFTALIVFLGLLLDAALAAVLSVAVFFLGLIPQAKMKRADLLVQLQERFTVLASDKDALGLVQDTNAAKVDQKKAAIAFYSKFWNLQILEFGLWRYGMLPSDTYAHRIVRRVLSFRDDNTEQYWGKEPIKGWKLVEEEFRGTDFHHFITVARTIGDEEFPTSAPNQPLPSPPDPNLSAPDLNEPYDRLHIRIERLLVAVSGGGLWSTFIIRWFNAQRPPLRKQTVKKWADDTKEPLRREGRGWRIAFFVLALASVVGAGMAGRWGQPYARRFVGAGSASFVVGPPAGGTIVLDPDHAAGTTFVVRFADEGSCGPGSDARRWRGASLTPASVEFVSGIAKALAACGTPQRPVSVEIAGFASSADFRTLRGCGPDNATAATANLTLASARAANVAAVLQRGLPQGTVTTREWNDAAEMETQRGFVDRSVEGVYSTDRGSLNRRVEIRVVNAGSCGAE